AGKIVVCKRGVIARVDKSKAVLEAGGVGMVMYNDPDSSLNADFHYVPTVHVNRADGLAIKAYAATTGATATINQSTIVYNAAAPFTASFSSRGPVNGAGGDLLKPDVMAPGQDILAAVSPSIAGRNFDLLSGTSMSSPHVAGLAALLMDLHPSWSPMAVKSALMTTGTDVLDGGTPPAAENNPVLIFRQGAGHVAPNSAADPGLVYNSGFNDWLAFLCGQVPGLVNPASCTALQGAPFNLSTNASDANLASIAIGDMAGLQTVKRRVTNVSGGPLTVNASVTGMAGITTVVTPSSLTLAAGETKSFTVSFTRTTAALGTYTGGQLRWTGGDYVVRSPIVVRPVALAAPAEVSGTAAGISYNVITGYAGTLNFGARGLVPATTQAANVAQDPDQNFSPTVTEGTFKVDIVVPAGTALLRAGTDESAVANPGTDLDVYIYRGTTLVALAADGDSNELATLANPTAATYTVYVHGFDTAGASTDFTLFSWLLGTADAGNMIVPGPATATVGGTVPVNLSFSGLTAGTWYLGQVTYNDGVNPLGTTIVSVR
ncbi:MAG TPA: S8 family serine peptidase, partial [Candidatus Limnocylindrales bacterium]|nr:S8 family serine peptidase [Candidatus Limnocylindrales bacterium]